MARKKHSKKIRSSRRRRVGSVGAVKMGGTILKDAALATAGYVAANYLGKLIPIQNNLVKAGAKVAAAFVTSKALKGATGNALALGMGVSGVVDLGKQFAPQFFAGVGEEPTILISGTGEDEISGIPSLGDMDSLGDLDNLGEIPTLAGFEDEM